MSRKRLARTEETDVKLINLLIPVAVITVYRLIPEQIRSIWSFGSSSSAAALAYARSTGNGWAAIRRYASPVRAFENQSWDN